MNLTLSSGSDTPELTVTRTKSSAESDFAVQVFLVDSYSYIHMSVAEARTLAERLLAATEATR